MAWHRVESSWVDAVDYQAETGTLYVRYKDKQGNPTVTCRYDNVDPSTGFGILSAPSKGKYVHRFLFRRPYTVVS